jgi:hypothetical protein
MSQPGTGVDAEQAAALNQRAVAGIRQGFERIDDGGERAVGWGSEASGSASGTGMI